MQVVGRAAALTLVDSHEAPFPLFSPSGPASATHRVERLPVLGLKKDEYVIAEAIGSQLRPHCFHLKNLSPPRLWNCSGKGSWLFWFRRVPEV